MNSHWEVVNNGGRDICTTPQQLWEAAVSYFKWCEDNPMKEKRTILAGRSTGGKVEVEFTRPFEIKAFCLHANVSERWITDLKEVHAKDSEWVMVMEKILYIIYNQNLEGAIVGTYNPIIVSKLLRVEKDESETDRPPRVEIVDSTSNKIATSEDDILRNLDFGKVEILKEKVEELKDKKS